MKAVGPRIERLYESQAERWRAAWLRFEVDLWRPVQYDEKQAYLDACAARGDAALVERVDLITGRWAHEAGLTKRSTGWNTFFDSFDAAVPHDLDTPDLSLWPEAVPQAPPDDGTEARLWEICRRDKGKGADERLAAGWVLLLLAARLYSREAR